MSDGSGESLSARKVDHIRICTDPNTYRVESDSAWFDRLRFVHRALPRSNFAKVSIATTFLGKPVAAPLFISSMTGGSAESYELNKIFARTAQRLGIAVGMGSIRILLRKPQALPDFQLKKLAPDVPVFANIGAAQLLEFSPEQILGLVDDLACDAIAVHLNAGQELAQADGDDNFEEWQQGLEAFIAASPLPVIVKETGFGIDPHTILASAAAGAAAIDIAGSGGTNWMLVEQHRLGQAEAERFPFDTWGIPTAVATAAAKTVLATGKNTGGRPAPELHASGGIRNGLDGAKAIALGAQSFGVALPLVRAAAEGGQDAVIKVLENYIRDLRVAIVLSGGSDVRDLQQAGLVRDTSFSSFVEQLVSASG